MGSALQSDGGNEARICGLKHQREKRSMAILLDWTFRSRRRASASFDDTGRIVREVKAASEPEALLQVLTNPAYHVKRIGLEAGPLSQWLFSALAEAGLPASPVSRSTTSAGC